MEKQAAVDSLGEQALVRPARVREALKANDRLKLSLTLVQAAAAHAAAPGHPPPDLGHEISAAGITDRDTAHWLRDLPTAAVREGHALQWPGWPRLAASLGQDLGVMARPLLDDPAGTAAFVPRVQDWSARLQQLEREERLDDATIGDLVRGGVPGDPGFHRLVMDLHRALNHLAQALGGETVAGAQVWQLAEDGRDHGRIESFMHGLARTRALKLDHPGLDTCATRDGSHLLIQNDIGTNDAHVLVLRVDEHAITLTYSDLHPPRFHFFCRLLEEVGAHWSAADSRITAGLNEGHAYEVGHARFEAADEAALRARLEDIGARIVFLIDWNRARKRLQAFVDKPAAIAVLGAAARRECGHMAWLAAGGERLIWNAMAAQGAAVFRLGDRLDAVLGADAARDFLIEVLALAQAGAARGQPPAFVADEARLLLAHRLYGRGRGTELLQEHAAWCHALAQGLRDGLAHGAERSAADAEELAARAKSWERQADELVVRARALAERQPALAPIALLAERSDDVADALEEASFVLSLIAQARPQGWGAEVQICMQSLADAVCGAVQDHVRAVAIGPMHGDEADSADTDEALDALWRVVQAERQCDELLRATRRALACQIGDDAVLLQLGNELAAALEEASDHLLALGHGVRRWALQAGETQA